jgi:hypothetical protein
MPGSRWLASSATSWSFGSFAGIVVSFHLYPHDPAGLEFDRYPGRYLHLLHGLGVLADAGSVAMHAEHAKIAKFQATAATQLANHLIQEVLDNLLDDDTPMAATLGYTINQLFLAHGCHCDRLLHTDLIRMPTLPSIAAVYTGPVCLNRLSAAMPDNLLSALQPPSHFSFGFPADHKHLFILAFLVDTRSHVGQHLSF